jgi:hypothetical protein
MMPSVCSKRQQTTARRLRCKHCCFFSGEVPQMNVLALHHNKRTPLLAILTPRDATMLRQAATRRNVLNIACMRDATHIRATTIETVPVDVVNLYAIPGREPQKFSMQKQCYLMAIAVHVAHRIAVIPQSPCPLPNCYKVGGVHGDVGARGPVMGSEGDPGCQPIITQDGLRGDRPAVGVVARQATEVFCAQFRRSSFKSSATAYAGNIDSHRDSNPVSVLRPGAVVIGGTGAFACLDFTTFMHLDEPTDRPYRGRYANDTEPTPARI